MAKVISNKKRLSIFKRDTSNCQYCGVVVDFENKNSWQIDHIIPISRGGNHSIENLKLACRSCNASKKNRNLERFRAIKALKETPYGEVISVDQLEKLISLGVEIHIPAYVFHFERGSYEC